MNYRQRLICYIICFSEEGITWDLNNLSIITNKSERTIRRDLFEIQEILNIVVIDNNSKLIKDELITKINIINNISELSDYEKELVNIYNQNQLDDNYLLNWIKSYYISLGFEIKIEGKKILFLLHNKILKIIKRFIDLSFIENTMNQINKHYENYLLTKSEIISMSIEKLFVNQNKKVNKDDLYINNFEKVTKINIEEFNEVIYNIFKEWLKIEVELKNPVIKKLYMHACKDEKTKTIQKEEIENYLVSIHSRLFKIIEKNNIYNWKLKPLSIVYFNLYFQEYIKTLNLRFITGCYGGQGTSVMIDSYIKSNFKNSTSKVITINSFSEELSKNKYDVIISTSQIDIKEDYIIVNPIEVITDNYQIIKRINKFLLNKIGEENEKDI